MGGAERNERKHKQQRASGGQAVAKARGGDNRKTIVTVAVVVLVAAVVIGGVLWTNASKNETEGQAIPAVPAQGVQYQGTRDGAVVTRGAADAAVTIDVYEDFLCPACGTFEQRYGEQIAERIKTGALRVRYHMMPLLVEASDPPGYSLDAANASLCAADAGKFVGFHNSLYGAQPAEGTRGYHDEQLIQLGRDLGITGEQFASCVSGGTYEQQLTAALEQASNDPALQRTSRGRKVFSTPTVVGPRGIVDVSNPQWLSELLAAARG